MAFFEIGQKRVDLDFRCIEVCVRLLWKSLVLFWWTTLIKAGDVPKCQCAYVKQLPDVDNDVTMPGHRLGNQVLYFKLSSPSRKNNSLQSTNLVQQQTLEINLNLVGRGVKQLNFKRIIRKIDQNCWARANRKILKWPKMVSNITLTNLKLKSHEEYLKSRTYFILKMTWFIT